MNAITDTATPARIKLIRDMVAESQGAYSELCDTFRAEGMGNADADTAAWALWVRYLHGELDITAPEEEATAPEPDGFEADTTDTATAEQLAIMHALAVADREDMRELSDTFRGPGMLPIDRWAAASKLWRRYLDGEFDLFTATFPAALHTIIEDTAALDGITTEPGRGRTLRLTGTADQLADLTDRVYLAVGPGADAEPRERAAYRRWTKSLATAGIRL